MAIPAHVQTAADKADEYLREQEKKSSEKTTTEVNTSVAPDIPDPEKEKALEAEEPDYKHQFSVMKGKYDAEVPRLHKQLRELKNKPDLGPELEALRSEISDIKNKSSKVPAKVIDSMPPHIKELMDDFSEESAKVLNWMMENQKPADNTDVLSRMEKLEKAQKDAPEMIRGQVTYEQELRSLIPDIDALNEDMTFNDYLDQFDPLYRSTYREQLNDAHTKGNAKLVAKFFNDWKSQKKGEQNEPKPNMGDKVQPSSNRSSVNKDPEVNIKIKLSEVLKFYDDAKNGVYRGREDEYARKDKEYFNAEREGRITRE